MLIEVKKDFDTRLVSVFTSGALVCVADAGIQFVMCLYGEVIFCSGFFVFSFSCLFIASFELRNIM